MVMLLPLEKTFSLCAVCREHHNATIARCLEEQAAWVDLKCTLSLWGARENHLAGRLLSLLEVPLWTEVTVRVDMSFRDTQTSYRGHFDSLVFVVVFTPQSSRDDNISVC